MASKQIPDSKDELLYVKRLQKGNLFYCGYKREYLARNLSEMEEGFITCSVCTGITREANLYKGETTCFVCSVSRTEFNPVKLVQNAVVRLEIRCPLLRECTWNGMLSEAESHLDTCTQFLIQCELCDVIVERGQYENHRVSLCLFRDAECEHCGKEGLYKDLHKHFKLCPEYPISCPNGCGEFLIRNQLSQHESICLLAVVTCPYGKYGCNAIPMLRRDLLAHKKDFYIEHQDMSLNEIQELNNEISRLNKEKHNLYCEGKTMLQLDGVKWEIQSINTLTAGHEITGPNFYVNKYAIQIYLIPTLHEVYGITLRFALKRVSGEFDLHLGKEYITQYRIVLLNENDRNDSHITHGEMDYHLKIKKDNRVVFGEVTCIDYASCMTISESLLVRLYFEVSSRVPMAKPKYPTTEYGGPFGIDIDPFSTLREFSH